MTNDAPQPAVGVTGATSQLGVFLLPRLREAGFAVVAVSRRAPQLSEREADSAAGGVTWVPPDALYAPAVASPITGLVSCGPLGLATEIVELQPELRRVIAFSSSSVHSKAASGDAGERAAMADLAAAESALTAACQRRKVSLLLLRPTLIYGCGLDRNVSRLAALARRFGVIPLAGPAHGLRQPVHADDLAGVAVRGLQRAEPVALESPVCGGDTISYREMAERIARAVPRRVRLLTLPEPLLAGAVRAMSRYERWQGLNAEMVHRQNRDLVFDDSPLRTLLDWNPRPFAPTPADFEIPADARALQLPVGARLRAN